MSFLNGQHISGEDTTHYARVIDNINAGIWEYHINTKKVIWSAGFYRLLGYKPDEIECSYKFFFENLLYYPDRAAFLQTTQLVTNNALPAHIRLLTKQQGYQWFESTTHKLDTYTGPVLYGTLVNIHFYKLTELKAAKGDFLSAETGRIARIGAWEIDIVTGALTLSKEVFEIYELTDETPISVEEAISFMEPEYRTVLANAIDNVIKYCKPYDEELILRTAKNNLVWVRGKGVPVVDDYGRCIKVRGIFQDIDAIKRRGITMQSSINLLDDQNKRLQNFAYIVSHNLRSHAGNLKFMVSLYEETDTPDERDEIFAHIKTISESFNATIGHLDEVVKIQSEISKGRKTVDLEATFNNVSSALSPNIAATNAVINADFSECSQIEYIPAYMESIFQNLLTNALKYKHPDRKPMIRCYTQRKGRDVYLVFEDNGLGIDLKRHGADIFGMYKTFHRNADSQGIGLFITRNQVEALGGSIQVESTVDVGTKFTVKLV